MGNTLLNVRKSQIFYCNSWKKKLFNVNKMLLTHYNSKSSFRTTDFILCPFVVNTMFFDNSIAFFIWTINFWRDWTFYFLLWNVNLKKVITWIDQNATATIKTTQSTNLIIWITLGIALSGLNQNQIISTF